MVTPRRSTAPTMPFSMWPGMWQRMARYSSLGTSVLDGGLLARPEEHTQATGARRHAGRRRGGHQVRRRGGGISLMPDLLHIGIADDEVVRFKTRVEDVKRTVSPGTRTTGVGSKR